MAITLAKTSVSLDVGTLFVIAICVTLLLGVVLLIAWLQERIPALGWWGAAYLIGGFSGALWQWSVRFASPVLVDLANVLLFLAVGMIWGAARLFHGRRVQWSPQLLGAAVLAGRVFFARIHAFGGFTHCAELADRRRLYVPDCRRAMARAAQIADPALARKLRAHAARGHLPLSGGAGDAFARRRDHPRSGRLGRRVCHRDPALRDRRRLPGADPGQGPDRTLLQIGGDHRSPDRRPQPSWLLRGCRRGHGEQPRRHGAGQPACL